MNRMLNMLAQGMLHQGKAALVSLSLLLSLGCSAEKQEPGRQNDAAPASTPPGMIEGQTEAVSFNEHVRPILSDRCFACHGPDAENQESPFRLDSQEASRQNLAKEGEPPRYGIVPGKPDESLVLTRILHEEPSLRMPPPRAKKKEITPAEVGILRQWILDGAPYEKHWAFLPPQSPSPPEVKQTNAIANDIDRFVLARLERKNIAANQEADPATLLRRLHLTLTGLNPDPEEAASFLQDPDPQRYEKAVDRLLQTPAFAERLTVDWMDVSRYADSYGYQTDLPREVWPWRDWVLNAFQNNLPYDQFIIQQLAGDLIPEPTQASRVATAFNRLHMQKAEGGSIPEEFRVEYVADRAQTASTAFMGLTMECARCHDHKFDPISQKDYFRTFALFNNIDESGMLSFFTRAVPSPSIPVLNDQESRQLADREQAVANALAVFERQRQEAQTDFQNWRKNWDGKVLSLIHI